MSTANDQAPQEPITDYEMGSDNIRPFGLDIHNPVFVVSAGVIIAFVVVALSFQKETAEFFGWLRPFLTKEFDWFLVLSVDIMTLFCLALIVLPVGSVRIGGKDAKPDYSYAGWIAMMFAAGIGIGLLFFGVLEPVYYNFAEKGGARPLNIDITQPGNEYIGVSLARSTIGAWKAGLFTPSSVLRWLSSATTRACHSPCVRHSIQSSVSEFGDGLDTSSTR